MKNRVLFSCLLIGLTILSCKKPTEPEKIKGCTDSNATNYNASAEENDGSCTYQGEVSMWFNEANSNSFVADGVTNLTVYFDDIVVGTLDPLAWTIGPECNGEDRLTVTVELDNDVVKNLDCIVRDQSGTVQFGSNFEVKGNECVSYQIF